MLNTFLILILTIFNTYLSYPNNKISLFIDNYKFISLISIILSFYLLSNRQIVLSFLIMVMSFLLLNGKYYLHESFSDDNANDLEYLLKKSRKDLKKHFSFDIKKIKKNLKKKDKVSDNIYEKLDMGIKQLNDMVNIYEKTIKN